MGNTNLFDEATPSSYMHLYYLSGSRLFGKTMMSSASWVFYATLNLILAVHSSVVWHMYSKTSTFFPFAFRALRNTVWILQFCFQKLCFKFQTFNFLSHMNLSRVESSLDFHLIRPIKFFESFFFWEVGPWTFCSLLCLKFFLTF